MAIDFYVADQADEGASAFPLATDAYAKDIPAADVICMRADLERGRRREGNRRVRAVANGRLLTTRLISLGCLSAEIADGLKYTGAPVSDAFLTPILRRLGRGFCYAYSLNPHEGLTGVLAAERMGLRQSR